MTMNLTHLPRSSHIAGIEWLGERVSYPDLAVKGDTFPMTWAEDDEIYTAAGDPLWGESTSGLDVERFSGMSPEYTIATIWAGVGTGRSRPA